MSEPPDDIHEPDPDGFGPGTFRADLPQRGPSWLRISRSKRTLIAAGVALFILAALGFANDYFLGDTPRLPESTVSLATLNRTPGMTFLDRNGAVMATRGARYGLKVRLADLPPYVPRAFLAAEDRRFYSHGAIDWRAVLRASWVNARAGRTVEGASTISQQLARDLFLGPQRTFKRKLQEMLLAENLYKRLGRNGVLELYLNRVYLGENAYGVDAAARTYFGKPARSLSLAEAAVLAGLPKAPSSLDPTENAAAAMKRGRLVLDRMAAEGWITTAQAEAAARQPVVLIRPQGEGDFGWVIDMAAAEAQRRAEGETDLVVRLTVDPVLQTAAARALRETLATEGARQNASQGALVLLAPDGSVRALIGGRDRQTRFNRATQARRQPGSAFKPFVWAAALEAGMTPETRVSTARIAMGPYTPDSDRSSPEMALEQALAASNNAVAVRLAQEAGTRRVADLARRFGVRSAPRNPGLSIALGAYETTLIELTAAYQPFQLGGRSLGWRLVEEVQGSDGRVIWRHAPPTASTVFDASRAGAMLRMMTAVVERGTGRRAAFGRPAAGKTGTSQDNRDAWFVGFTPDWLAGVWIGNDDNKPMRGVEGGSLPADVWRKLMIAAHGELPLRAFDAQSAEGVIVRADGADPGAGMEAIDAADRESFYRTLAAEFDRASRE